MELLGLEIFRNAFIAGALLALACSGLSVFVVLRGLSFIGAGISHAAFAGVVIGVLLGVSPLYSALVFCVLIALLISSASSAGVLKEDSAIGMLFSGSMALGVFLLGFSNNQSFDIWSYFFGSILAISNSELYFCLALSTLVVITVVLFYKELFHLIFDETLAFVSGINTRFFHALLLVLLAITTVASMKLVGLILVSALLVVPGAIAVQLSSSFDRVLLIAVLIGVSCVELGLLLSYFLDLAPGATVVLLLIAVFAITKIMTMRRLG